MKMRSMSVQLVLQCVVIESYVLASFGVKTLDMYGGIGPL